jgi:non-heme chloroperoxidase
MDRRTVLTAAASGLAGAALFAASAPATSAEARTPRRRAIVSTVETADGAQLFCRDWGEGTPLVFLSGWGLPSDNWCYVMAPLSANGFRCVAYDRRGHGRSTDPGGGYDYDTLADDLARVLKALDLRNITLVAHSMSGGEAVRYLSHNRKGRVARVLLLATTLPYLTRTADNPDGIDPQFFEKFRARLLQDFPNWLRESSRSSVLPDTSEALMEWGIEMMQETSFQAILECNRAMAATDFRAELRQITLPTLLIHGDKDVSVPIPLSAAKVAKLMPHAQLKVYEGGPHSLQITHAAQLRQDLVAFARA